MRNTFFLLVFLISGVCFSQNPDPFWDGIRTKLVQPDTLSTFDRDALTPKLGTILYHKDIGISQWEQWDGSEWVEFGAGAEYTFSDTAEIDFTLTGDDVTADIVTGSIDETKLDASVNSSLDLADSSVQPGDISGFVTLTTNQTITGAKIFDTGTNVTNISSEYTGTGFGLGSLNSGTGTGIFSFNLSDGIGIVSNGASISTGNVYEGQNDGTTTFYVNKEGDVGANSFITTGGTSDDFVKGDGSLDSGSYQSTITGAASTIVTSDLTNNRVLISNGSGKVAVSAVTSTELSYLSGVTSALQTQLNSKLNSSSYTAADVLSKLLTVDGSGSGLDADLLRGVHWGNVNTNIVTTGDITGRDGFFTRNGTAIVEIIGEGTVGGIVGTDTNHDLVLRRNNAEVIRLTTAGATVTGNLTATGTVTATNFILSSDKRLKENFKDLGNGYYSFEFKDTPGEKRYGVIAQEVKEYAPELVSEGADGYYKVAYIDLLIKKIAELEARVKELEKK